MAYHFYTSEVIDIIDESHNTKRFFLGKFMQPPFTSIESDICLICTGTGIAPFRSLLLDIKNRNVPHHKIDLIFGSRNEVDILYRSEMEELTNALPGFRYTTVLSREQSPLYRGEKGYVHAVYEKLFLDKRPATFYICGWKEMVKEARERLQNMGYDKKNIKFELYD
jgi:NAD(P)H-flavin reductase